MEEAQEAQEDIYGWDGLLLDEGCFMWDSCVSCALPKCKEDVGTAAARAAALAVGITPMNRGKKCLPHRVNFQTVEPRVMEYFHKGWSITKTATATGIKWERVARVFYKHGYERRPAKGKEAEFAVAI